MQVIHDMIDWDTAVANGFLIGSIGWDNTEHWGKHVNKGVDRVVIEKVIIKPKEIEAKKVILDETTMVCLGGTFEKIGEDDESVGGNNQKVGSANKR